MHTRLLVILATVFSLLGAVSLATAQEGYRVKSGDVLDIEVFEDQSLNSQVLVLPDGTYTFPLVGTMKAGGLTVEQVRSSLVSALASNFAVPPSIYVSVRSLAQSAYATPERTIDVYVMGEIVAPGKKEITSGTTILQFLAQSGGLGRFAADKRIELHRNDASTGETTIYLFDYTGKTGGGIASSTTLRGGDVIIVPERGLFE
jgi:polysaccharide export outer membrane protein